MDNKKELHQQILELEEKLFKPEIRHSEVELNNLLSDSFIEFGSSGKIYNRQTIIEELKQETFIKISMSEFQTKLLAKDIIIATYKANIKMSMDEAGSNSFRKSIWKLIDGSWKMIFHEGTPIA